MQTNNPEAPVAKLAVTQQPHPSKVTPIGRDISDAKLRALKPAEKAYRQTVGGGLYLEVMPKPSLQKKIDVLEASHGRLHTQDELTKEWLGLKTGEKIAKMRRLNMMKRVVFPKLGALPRRRPPGRFLLLKRSLKAKKP